MDKQIKYLIGVLVILIITAYFLSLLSGLPNFIKDDIIAFLERETGGEISLDKVSLWPLNRINVKNFKFKDKLGNAFAADELNLDYSLNLMQDNNIILFDFVELKNADIEINNLNFGKQTKTLDIDQLNGKDIEQLNKETSAADSENSAAAFFSELKLPDYLADLNMNIRDAAVEVKLEDYHFSVQNLQLGMKVGEVDNFEVNFSSALSIDRLKLAEGQIIEDLSLDNLDFQLKKSGSNTELYFDTAEIELSRFYKYLPQKNFNYNSLNIDAADFSGRAAVRGEAVFNAAKISSYRAEINLNNLVGSAAYIFQQEESETINIELPQALIVLEGPEFEAALEQTEFNIDQNSLQFGFKFSENAKLEISAEAENFVYDYNFLSPHLKESRFDFQFSLERDRDGLLEGELTADVKKLKALDFDFEDSEFELRLAENEVYLDRANLNFVDGGQFNLKASYNLASENYILRAEGNDLDLNNSIEKIINNFELEENRDYLDRFTEIADENVNFLIDAAGIYGLNNQFSAAGEFQFDFNLEEDNSDCGIDSSFWFYENNLTLSSFKFESEYLRLDLSGDIDFNNKDMQLRYAGSRFNPLLINRVLAEDIAQLNELNSVVEHLEGSIAGSFSSPSVSLTAEIPYLSYQNFNLSSLRVKSSFENGNLELQNLQADLAQGTLRASGMADNLLSTSASSIDLQFQTENVYFDDISEAINRELPLTGEVQVRLLLSGKTFNPELNLKIMADNTVLAVDGNEYEFTSLNAAVKRDNGRFELSSLSAVQQDLEINADGYYIPAEGLDLNLKLSGFETEKYLAEYIPEDDTLSGELNLEGNLRGEISSPELQFKLFSDSLKYNNLNIKFLDNDFLYQPNQDRLYLNSFNFKVDDGDYALEGELDQLSTNLTADLQLQLNNVPVKNTLNQFVPFYPFAEDLIVSGPVEVKGNLDQPSAVIDLDAVTAESQDDVLSLSGKVAKDLDLIFSSSVLPIDFMTDQFGFNLNLKSKLDMDGSIRGNINSPILKIEHQLSEISLNETKIKSLNGKINLEDRTNFSLEQQLQFSGGGTFNLNGDYSFESQEIKLNSDLDSLPLGFLLSFIGEGLTADGNLNGNAVIRGNINSPDLEGEIKVSGSNLEVGLSDPIEDYSGLIKLNNSGFRVEDLKGKLADGNFTINGNFNPFSAEDAWNLSLTGNKLYFLYGSLDGEFDAELEFVGPLADPVLRGDLRAYNFKISIPWEWPMPEGESENGFVPEIDLNIVSGRNVRVVNPNMNIYVEEGNLNLKFNDELEDPLTMQGRFRSTRGNFTYYNSRFSLLNGEVVFTPVDENDIPTISANARTYAGGREITISVNGPANDMRTTLSSNPEMTEDEILNLLTTQGALGSAIIGDEDIGIEAIITQELIRMINAFLQRDVINPLESDFQSALALDRIEIDTSQYGLEREFALYLGKNITNNFYIEYASFFTEEESSGEISFQYRLTDRTVLKGTYFGDEEYQFSIETGIDF
jgi:translocation and assembly module TamB